MRVPLDVRRATIEGTSMLKAPQRLFTYTRRKLNRRKEIILMIDKHQLGGQEHVPATRRRKPIPLRMASGPQDYTPGQQEEPAVLTSLADMLHWAQNWARSRSIWPFMYALACCGFEMIAAASAPQYDLSRFGSEVFRASPRQADLMIVAGTVSVKMAPRLRHLWEQMAEPRWVISMGQCANSGGEFYDSYYTVQGVDTVVPVDVYVPGCPPRPEALIEGIFKLREKIEKQGYIPRTDQNSALTAPVARPAQGGSDAGEQTGEAPHTQEMLLNMGPQHPSTHGVLRLMLTLEGETVLDCTPVIGYLHRGIEKTLENRPYMAYREVPVQVQTQQEGDCYARNAVRFQEIQESIRLCRVAIDHLLPGPISTR